jgi:hypothetical protein
MRQGQLPVGVPVRIAREAADAGYCVERRRTAGRHNCHLDP